MGRTKTPPGVGDRFGRLVVADESWWDTSLKQPRHRVPVRCDCGEEFDLIEKNWGRTKSCGCAQREAAAETHGRHGMSSTRLHRVWRGMRERCNNPNRKEYPNYGGRGIYVCAEWGSFEKFAAWAEENDYADDLDIDRIDNDGPYSPENCRFVTRSENLRNNRHSRQLTALGETKSLIAWSEDERCRVSYATLSSRVNKGGWDPEDAILTPKGRWNPKRKASS